MALRTYDFSKPVALAEEPLLSIEAAQAKSAGRELIYTGPSPHGWHEVGLFLRCPQLYEHHIAGRLGGADEKDYLTRGTLVHVGLAHYYTRKGAKQKTGVVANGVHTKDPDRWHEPLVAVALAAERMHAEGDSFALKKLPLAQKLVQAYITVMAGSSMDYGIQIVGVEVVTEIKCGPQGVPYTARMDLAVGTSDGAIQAWDHKILARVDRARAQYSFSGQIHGHRAIGHVLWGPKFGGSRLNVLSADPEDFTVERVMPYAAPALSHRLPDTVAQARSLIALYKQVYAPGNWPVTYACVDAHGRRCEGWDLCSGVGGTGIPR